MKLSIIVPFYNMAADGKLNYCMDSLLGQTIGEGRSAAERAAGEIWTYEILAVDDCSTDDTFILLTAYAEKYPGRVRALKTPYNKKQGGARNLGIDCARGEWIGFMDGDDWAAPDMYEKLLRKAGETGADVVGCDLHQTNEHSDRIGKIVNANTMDQTGILNEEKYKKLVLNPCSMVIKIYQRSVINEYELRFPEGIFYEDNCAGPIWMLHFRHFEKVQEPLYYYYQDPASTTHFISEKKCEDRMKAGELLLAQCRQYGFFEQYQKELEFAFSKLYYVNTLFTYVIGVAHTRPAFLRKLKRGILREFPDFQENPYFIQEYDREQKKLIRLHLRSSVLFLLFYKALTMYRKLGRRQK